LPDNLDDLVICVVGFDDLLWIGPIVI
jgi:hypothetical protein